MAKIRDSEFKMLSEAIQAWYSFYEVSPDARASQFLSNAATNLFNEGCKTADDIASVLIGTYVGIWSTKVNSPTSASVH
jgi:hypothetical protein